jgi:hypothetical protein
MASVNLGVMEGAQKSGMGCHPQRLQFYVAQLFLVCPKEAIFFCRLTELENDAVALAPRRLKPKRKTENYTNKKETYD